jgi:hypothetical protein
MGWVWPYFIRAALLLWIRSALRAGKFGSMTAHILLKGYVTVQSPREKKKETSEV